MGRTSQVEYFGVLEELRLKQRDFGARGGRVWADEAGPQQQQQPAAEGSSHPMPVRQVLRAPRRAHGNGMGQEAEGGHSGVAAAASSFTNVLPGSYVLD
jgi:hypothetical protein